MQLTDSTSFFFSAIENKGVVVGMNPETSEKVVERDIEKENENDSNDAYLVDELTEAFTECNPFALPAYTAGQTQGQYFVMNSGENSLELIELSSMNIVRLVLV